VSDALLRFADELGSSGPAEVAAPVPELHLVTFTLDREAYGVPVQRVREVIRVGEITRVPQAPEHVRGVTNLRPALGDAQSLTFTTASGDVSAGRIVGALTTKGASGDVDVRSVGGIGTVNTVSGDVRIGPTDDTLAVNAVSGDIELDAVGAAVRASTVSGDVRVAARQGLALWIDAQSVSGTLSSELDVEDAPAAEPGAPQVELRIRTVSGDVRIARSRIPVGG